MTKPTSLREKFLRLAEEAFPANSANVGARIALTLALEAAREKQSTTQCIGPAISLSDLEAIFRELIGE